MVLCLCKNVSDQMVREAILKGAASLKEIRQINGIGSGCGECLTYVQNFVKKEMKTMDRHKGQGLLFAPPGAFH